MKAFLPKLGYILLQILVIFTLAKGIDSGGINDCPRVPTRLREYVALFYTKQEKIHHFYPIIIEFILVNVVKITIIF